MGVRKFRRIAEWENGQGGKQRNFCGNLWRKLEASVSVVCFLLTLSPIFRIML